ncbi:MAG: hypothetical protein M3Q65_13150, partial [Chloroflexota bacterium]|nr:hypothetical protein [Chloroflexota bacterium]
MTWTKAAKARSATGRSPRSTPPASATQTIRHAGRSTTRRATASNDSSGPARVGSTAIRRSASATVIASKRRQAATQPASSVAIADPPHPRSSVLVVVVRRPDAPRAIDTRARPHGEGSWRLQPHRRAEHLREHDGPAERVARGQEPHQARPCRGGWRRVGHR